MGLRTSIRNRLLHLLFGNHFVGNPLRENRTLALTFDDGPDPIHTPKVLDILKENGVKATFFLIGKRAEQHPEIVRRMLDDGHHIGNHAYRHVNFAALPLRDQLAEINKTDHILTSLDGSPWHWFRPPQGRLPLKLLLAMVRERRRLAMWSYDSLDYQSNGAAAILSRFQENPVGDGEIVLLHDDNDATVLALKPLLAEWRVQGFELILLGRSPVSS